LKRLGTFITLIALLASANTAFAYEFWGITLGTQEHDGHAQLTFDGVAASGAGYAVGGYKYTRVDGQWLGAFEAASPGEGFLASRKSDAQGIFFRADVDVARFVIIAGSNQSGSTAPECGTGTRLFGPGDLRIDTDTGTYGVGLRLSGLTWALDPNTTNPEFRVIRPDGTYDSVNARDGGTLGVIEMNPDWARVGHSTLPAGSDLATAFYVAGSGDVAGTASIGFEHTGIVIEGAGVYAYSVEVPWTAIGMTAGNYDFRASWRPDCGNDLIGAEFSSLGVSSVPEPGSLAALAGGLTGLLAFRKR